MRYGKDKTIKPIFCVLIFSTILSEIFIILRSIARGIIIKVHTLSYKVAINLVRF